MSYRHRKEPLLVLLYVAAGSDGRTDNCVGTKKCPLQEDRYLDSRAGVFGRSMGHSCDVLVDKTLVSLRYFSPLTWTAFIMT